MRKLNIVIAAALIAIYSVSSRAELVFDGSPRNDIGEDIGRASAQLLDGVSWFFVALENWERPINADGRPVPLDARRQASRAAFDQFLRSLRDSRAQFELLLSSNRPALDASLGSPNEDHISRIGARDILDSYGIAPPSRYGDLVEIARGETTRLESAAREIEWSGDLQTARASALLIVAEVRRAVEVGLAVSAFVEEPR